MNSSLYVCQCVCDKNCMYARMWSTGEVSRFTFYILHCHLGIFDDESLQTPIARLLILRICRYMSNLWATKNAARSSHRVCLWYRFARLRSSRPTTLEWYLCDWHVWCVARGPGGFKTLFCYSGATTNDEQVKPRSLRFTWSMKTTSSRDPNEIMSEIRKVLQWNITQLPLSVLVGGRVVETLGGGG